MIALCARLNIEAPILQAPIGSASCPALVAAVSSAGALGMLAGTWRTNDELRQDIREIQKGTSKPFAINLGVHASPEEKIEICLRERVPIVSLFWGDGRKFFQSIKRAGAKVIATVGNASEARDAADAGADAIIAQGFEAGGHVWGKTTTLALIPEVAEVVRDVAIVAAGGVSDARSVVTVIGLGASGACLGTRFLLATESLAHPIYQSKIIQARADDTVYGNIFEVGWPNAPHRVLRNAVVDDFLQRGRTGEGEIVANAPDGSPVVRYSSRMPIRGMTGNVENMALYAGQSVGHCKKIQPAAEIVAELMEAIR
jgi:NAD(P)H-dependent flavin oxidoreductase YrpB (nitropropane dioxygenase family)